MFFRFDGDAGPEARPEISNLLRQMVGSHMPGVDDATVASIGALAGLLGRVAYADNELDASELAEIRRQLSRVEPLDEKGIEAVCTLLREQGEGFVGEGIHAFTRILYEDFSREARLEVLDVLLDLAAADGKVTMDETNILRRICTALGLSDDDYNASQARHKSRLSVLDTE